jgi:hypothetical protein
LIACSEGFLQRIGLYAAPSFFSFTLTKRIQRDAETADELLRIRVHHNPAKFLAGEREMPML